MRKFIIRILLGKERVCSLFFILEEYINEQNRLLYNSKLDESSVRIIEDRNAANELMNFFRTK